MVEIETQNKLVKETMQQIVISTDKNSNIAEASFLMANYNIGILPVVEKSSHLDQSLKIS